MGVIRGSMNKFLLAAFVALVFAGLVACWPHDPGGEALMVPERTSVDASAPDAGRADVAIVDAAPLPEAAPAPVASAPPPPAYKLGSYRQRMPAGAVTIPTVDGGVVRFKDAQECPCMWGCVTAYGFVSQGVARDHGSDDANINGDTLACMLNCKRDGACRHGWPGVTEQ